MKIVVSLIGFLIAYFPVYSQVKIVKEYEKKSGLCSSSLKLYGDSTYLYENGCEGQSYVNFGKWLKKKDVTELFPVDTTSYIAVDKAMESVTETGDSTFLIKVIDQYGVPIKNFPLVVVSDSYDFENPIPAEGQYIYRNKITNAYELFEPNHTDEKGIIFSALKTNFHIILTFPNDKIVIKYDNSRYNTISLKMALNRDVFNYYDPKWIDIEQCEFEGKIFKFLKQ